MTKTSNEPTMPAGNATPASTAIPPKTRRPRLMAREGEVASEAFNAQATPASKTASPRTDTKIASVIALLKREQGATLAELVETTGWLPHTTRAALTGLKRKGHVIAKTKRGETTCYAIQEAA